MNARLRRLERLAAEGDTDASLELHRERARRGDLMIPCADSEAWETFADERRGDGARFRSQGDGRGSQAGWVDGDDAYGDEQGDGWGCGRGSWGGEGSGCGLTGEVLSGDGWTGPPF